MIGVYIISLIICLIFVFETTIENIDDALNKLFIEHPEFKEIGGDSVKIYKIFILISFIPVINTIFATSLFYIKFKYKL